MSRRPITLLLALAALCALALPAAASAKKKAKVPEITRVTPMRIVVGAKLTIRGKNFKARKGSNTVVFRASNGRSAFAKPISASTKKLVVKVPVAVKKITGQKTLRFKLRVLAGKFSKFTPKRLSPVVVGDTSKSVDGGGGQSSCAAGDYDGDLLPGSVEAAIKTDPCLPDTDLDGVSDGYEQQSAVDLNNFEHAPSPLPYPGKRPFPNALDPSDVNFDYDGDGLTLGDEYKLWATFGGHHLPLNYSDGLQRSVNQFGPVAPPLAVWITDMNGDNKLSDDERDADGDGLNNWDESHGRMTQGFWNANKWCGDKKESVYPGRNFSDPSMTDADSDGDGVLDGADDQDADGLSNAFEVRRPADVCTTYVSTTHDGAPSPNPWARVQPFNPCKPVWSARCHLHPPIAYYPDDEDWASPVGYYPNDGEWTPALPPPIGPPPATPAG